VKRRMPEQVHAAFHASIASNGQFLPGKHGGGGPQRGIRGPPGYRASHDRFDHMMPQCRFSSFANSTMPSVSPTYETTAERRATPRHELVATVRMWVEQSPSITGIIIACVLHASSSSAFIPTCSAGWWSPRSSSSGRAVTSLAGWPTAVVVPSVARGLTVDATEHVDAERAPPGIARSRAVLRDGLVADAAWSRGPVAG